MFWKEGDLESLLTLMMEVAINHASIVAALPEIEIEDNAKKLADSIERLRLKKAPAPEAREFNVGA